jgi:hypothetical protein
MVVPIRLTTSLATHQDMMKYILSDLCDKGTIVNIDDIIIYTLIAKSNHCSDKVELNGVGGH